MVKKVVALPIRIWRRLIDVFLSRRDEKTGKLLELLFSDNKREIEA